MQPSYLCIGKKIQSKGDRESAPVLTSWLDHMKMEHYTQLHMLVELSNNTKRSRYHRTRSTSYHVDSKTLPPLSLWTLL